MTQRIVADIVVVGSGFAGSLAAILLHRIGFQVVLIERGQHPRFALGESSTPTADLVLRDLASAYDLPWLHTLSRYGTWKQAYPDVTCGPKRGFSYFAHQANQSFTAFPDHRNELLVAASHDEAHSDTHWLRSEVDALFVRQAIEMGIGYFDRTTLRVEENQPKWKLIGERKGEDSLAIEADFIIDSTGEAGFLPQALDIPPVGDQMATWSEALFAHFRDVSTWDAILMRQDAALADHPFPCDAAALHHLLNDHWMWQLRFDNGVTSAGIVSSRPLREDSPDQLWHDLLTHYPSLAAQFEHAKIIAPGNSIIRSGRLQRQWAQTTGTNWALLPHTAGFVDPLYSSGIAQAVCGVEQLATILEQHWQRDTLSAQLRRYGETVRTELRLIDQLIAGSYAAMPRFELFVPWTMLYFAAVTTYETRRLDGRMKPGGAMLCADDMRLMRIIQEARYELDETLAQPPSDRIAKSFFGKIARLIEPFNVAGLCDEAVHNMYRYTAVDKT